MVWGDVLGSEIRRSSVMNGLNSMKDCKKVLLIVAARPLVTIEQLQSLTACQNDSISFVAPCVNTIIKKDKTYINHNECLRMPTPQIFQL